MKFVNNDDDDDERPRVIPRNNKSFATATGPQMWNNQTQLLLESGRQLYRTVQTTTEIISVFSSLYIN